MQLSDIEKSVEFCIPIFNEEECMAALRNFLEPYLGASKRFSVLFVDDGSTDRTYQLLLSFKERFQSQVKLVRFSKNFGLKAALQCLIDETQADYSLFIDGDLQDPVEMIPEMLDQAIGKSFEVVEVRRPYERENFFKNILFNGFHRALSFMSEVPVEPNLGNFSVVSQRAVKVLRDSRERNFYFPLARRRIGFRRTTLVGVRKKRVGGSSKQTFMKLLNYGVMAIMGNSVIPIRLVTLFAVFNSVILILASLVFIGIKLFTSLAIPGWTSVMFSLTFFAAIQSISQAVMAEYISQISEEVRRRQTYVVDERDI